MSRQGRLGDKAYIALDSHGCPVCSHPASGPAISGSPDVRVNRRPALRVDDRGVHAACCGTNRWTATEGSGTVFINGRAAHRIGDATKHCGGNGKLTEGSDNVDVGGGRNQQVRDTRCANLSNQWFYGTDTSIVPNHGCYDDFYIGKIGRDSRPIPAGDAVPSSGPWSGAAWRDRFIAARTQAGFRSVMPSFDPQGARFNSPLSSPARNFAYWTITHWEGPDPDINSSKWGILQGLLALLMARNGPFAARIGGRCVFADVEGDWPATQASNQAVLHGFLSTVAASGDFTPGVYTNQDRWNTVFGASYTPEIDFVLFTAEWLHGNTVTVNGDGAVPPTPAELAAVFGPTPRQGHSYGGQQTRIWQFSSEGGANDWDITPFDPLTNFSIQLPNPRKGASVLGIPE